MKKIYLFFIFFFPVIIFAQDNQDNLEIIYHNKSGIVVEKALANSYRVIFWDSIRGKTVLIKEFKNTGELVESGYYKMNNRTVKDGICNEYYLSGNIGYIKNYSNNKLNGDVFGYYYTGQIRRQDFFKNDTLISGKCYTLSGKDTTYFPMQVIPTFFGGHSKLISYITENIKYPLTAQNSGLEGRVVVDFCIDVDGKISETSIRSFSNYLFIDEARRVVKNTSGFWTPGYLEGQLTKMWMSIPIAFTVKK